MKWMMLMMALNLNSPMKTLFDFSKDAPGEDWYILDDVVMGGQSAGTFDLSEEGYGRFKGSVSLENNGGFSSVRYRPSNFAVVPTATVRLRIKGDGKKYQFRVKSETKEYYSYITTFETSGDWETVELSLADMYPSWRGRKLDIPNFDKNQLAEISFLIANYKAEDFELLIDWIEVSED
jgi:NADH dehydrogenase [ubiquinone] 1 alpha subcomplex assembly factor 1